MSRAVPPSRPADAAAWSLRMMDRELSTSERAELDAWLEADPAHGRALTAALAAFAALEEARDHPRLAEMRAEALADWARRAGGPRAPLRRAALGIGVGGLAAAGLAAAGVGVWLQPAVYRTGLGERRVVELDDGSRISLDSRSEVAVRYSGARRRLELRAGRAKFSVAKDPLRPFTVTAAGRMVVAVGTEFSVELLGGLVRVVLYEGKVAVLDAKADAGAGVAAVRSPRGAPQAALEPGHELVLPGGEAASAAAPSPAPIDPVRSLAWEAGQVVLDDEPLGAAVERVNRYSHDQLRVGDPRAAAVKVSGVFTAGDTDAFVAGVRSVFPVEVRADRAGRTFVYRRSAETPRGR